MSNSKFEQPAGDYWPSISACDLSVVCKPGSKIVMVNENEKCFPDSSATFRHKRIVATFFGSRFDKLNRQCTFDVHGEPERKSNGSTIYKVSWNGVGKQWNEVYKGYFVVFLIDNKPDPNTSFLKTTSRSMKLNE